MNQLFNREDQSSHDMNHISTQHVLLQSSWNPPFNPVVTAKWNNVNTVVTQIPLPTCNSAFRSICIPCSLSPHGCTESLLLPLPSSPHDPKSYRIWPTQEESPKQHVKVEFTDQDTSVQLSIPCRHAIRIAQASSSPLQLNSAFLSFLSLLRNEPNQTTL